MSHLVDTSLLVRQADLRSVTRPTALKALGSLIRQGEYLPVLEQNLIEFWAVATRPHTANGLGFTVAQADDERRRLESIFTLLPTPPGLYQRWAWLVNQNGVSGKPTHDARIVAAMLEHSLTHILTFNVRDFQRYAPLGIVAVDPATVP